MHSNFFPASHMYLGSQLLFSDFSFFPFYFLFFIFNFFTLTFDAVIRDILMNLNPLLRTCFSMIHLVATIGRRENRSLTCIVSRILNIIHLMVKFSRGRIPFISLIHGRDLGMKKKAFVIGLEQGPLSQITNGARGIFVMCDDLVSCLCRLSETGE